MSTLATTNLKNPNSVVNSFVLNTDGSVVISGLVTFVSGYAADSITVTGSTPPANGIYLPSGNTLGIATSGVGRVFVDASGNVEISGTARRIRGDFSNGTHANRLSLQSNVTNGATSPFLLPNGTSTAAQLVVSNGSDPTNASYLSVGCFGGALNESRINSNYLGGGTALPITFQLNNQERLRITTDGKLGIGTSSVSYKLDINNTSGGNGGFRLLSTDQSTTRIRLENTGVGGRSYEIVGGLTGVDNSTFTVYDATAAATRLAIDSSGRVGIGTTSPGAKLDVSGNILSDSSAGETVFSSSGNWNYANFYLRRNASNIAAAKMLSMMLNADNTADTTLTNYLNIWGSYSGTPTTGSTSVGLSAFMNLGAPSGIAMHTNGSERARIDSSGRLLVGTSSARANLFNSTFTSQLQVEGTSYSTASASIVCNSTTSETSVLSLSRSRGSTVGSNTLVQDGDFLGVLAFQGNDGTEFVQAAAIRAEVNGAPGANDMPGRLVFSATADGFSGSTDIMWVTGSAEVAIGGRSVTGDGYGYLWVQTNSSTPAYINRLTTDGGLIDFRQDFVSEGSISVAGNTVSYNQFLGAHWAALSDWTRPDIKIGTILESINELTDWKYAVIDVDGEQKKICYNGTAAPGSTVTIEYNGQDYQGTVELEAVSEFNKAVKVKVNDTAASKAVYGVFVGWNTDSILRDDQEGIWNDMYVGAVGNYVIRLAPGQTPSIGDLIEADGTGCGVVQSDDIIRTKTVAKVTSTIPQVTYDDGSFLVTCVLYCG